MVTELFTALKADCCRPLEITNRVDLIESHNL